MGFLGKFTNAISNGIHGITNKVSGAWNTMKDTASNAWEKTKGVAGKVWEGVKDAAVKTGKFIYDNSDAIAAGLGTAAMGAAGYFGGPEAALAVREGLSGLANAIPDGKVKDALLSAAWKRKKKEPEPAKVDLIEENPGGVRYAENVGGNYGQKSSAAIPVSGYDPLFVQNTSAPLAVPHPIYYGKYTHKKTGRRKIKPPNKNMVKVRSRIKNLKKSK